MRNFTRTKSILKCFSLSLSLAVCVPDANAQVTKKQDIPQFSQGRWGAMSFTINNTIYVAGGYAGTSGGWMSDLQSYDAAQDKWTGKADLPGGINATNRSAGVAFTINGKGYMGLGARDFLSISLTQVNYNTLWEYDPAGNAWAPKKSLPDSGRTDAGVFVINNKAYVVGGERSTAAGGATKQVWEYDPAADKWTAKADYPIDVRNPYTFVINGKGYVTGGMSGSANTLKTYEYDPAANKWTAKADFIDSARRGGVAFVHGGKGYIMLGGAINGPYPTTMYKYDPASNSWTYTSNKWTAQGRMFGVTEIIGDKVYAGCGWRLDGGSTQTFFKDWYEIDMVKVLGVEDAAVESKLLLYPNPATNIVYINIPGRVQGERYQCRIFNMTGQMVYHTGLNKGNSIETGHLPAGQYIIEVNNGNGNYRAILSLRSNP